jgi:hypothetical protein
VILGTKCFFQVPLLYTPDKYQQARFWRVSSSLQRIKTTSCKILRICYDMMISIFWFHTGVLTNILLINLSISIPNKFDKSKENRQIIYRRSYRCSATKRCPTRRSNINALIQTNDNHSLCFASIPALIVYHSSNINTP